jgi:hypothetical protein
VRTSNFTCSLVDDIVSVYYFVSIIRVEVSRIRMLLRAIGLTNWILAPTHSDDENQASVFLRHVDIRLQDNTMTVLGIPQSEQKT